MKFNNTPKNASVFKLIFTAALFFMMSLSANAQGQSGRIQLASLNTNDQQAAPARPNPEELFAASLRGDIRTVQRLVRERVNVNHRNADSETALHMAASRGHLSVVIFLLNNGANINPRTRNNWIPLHHAVRFNRPNVANYLMAKGAPPHFKTGDGLDSFDIAVNMSNVQMINMVQRYMNQR